MKPHFCSASGCLQGTGAYCASGGHNDIQVAPGVYRREFKQCYNRGVLIGQCAAIVNTTGSGFHVGPPGVCRFQWVISRPQTIHE